MVSGFHDTNQLSPAKSVYRWAEAPHFIPPELFIIQQLHDEWKVAILGEQDSTWHEQRVKILDARASRGHEIHIEIRSHNWFAEERHCLIKPPFDQPADFTRAESSHVAFDLIELTAVTSAGKRDRLAEYVGAVRLIVWWDAFKGIEHYKLPTSGSSRKAKLSRAAAFEAARLDETAWNIPRCGEDRIDKAKNVSFGMRGRKCVGGFVCLSDDTDTFPHAHIVTSSENE